MELKTVQWNIGGGNIREVESDPKLSGSYKKYDLAYVTDYLRNANPDVITFQESHADAQGSQAEEVARALGYEYFYNDEYADSHITKGQRLSQSILSRFPILQHTFVLFVNPHYKMIAVDGEEWITHDKGISSCDVLLPNSKTLKLQTLHVIPFRKYGVEALGRDAELVREDIQAKIDTHSTPFLLQGDFNYNDSSLSEFLPEVFKTQTEEINVTAPTTPKGRKYDHILFRGLQIKNHEIDESVLTDHYPLLTTFEF